MQPRTQKYHYECAKRKPLDFEDSRTSFDFIIAMVTDPPNFQPNRPNQGDMPRQRRISYSYSLNHSMLIRTELGAI